MKRFLRFGVMGAMAFTFLFGTSSADAQTGKKTPMLSGSTKFEIFSEKIPAGAQTSDTSKFLRRGGYMGDRTSTYIYVNPSHSPAEIKGLSLPIRENPGPGEYRYITFAWVKWGGEQIGIALGHQLSAKNPRQTGKKYNYTYYAGKGEAIQKGLQLSDKVAGHWMVTTRDLWKDFGDFTLTGVSMICPDRRDAGFDAIFLGQNVEDFGNTPGLLPTEVTAPVEVDEDGNIVYEEINPEEAAPEEQKVVIDWAAQIRAGGFMMYPLYFLALLALLIALQRWMTSREGRLAPRKLRRAVDEQLSDGNIVGAIEACDRYPSTLAEALRFILQHRHAGREVVSQTAGDIAARDIRTHLSRIYPLSVIASLAPLLGLLGTIVGMIEAFGLVALYGDEGGAAILSDSISKALITTAAGLIIAVPAIAVYFVIKNRIMRLGSLIEVGIENVVNELYLKDDTIQETAINEKEEHHAAAH